LRKICEVNQPAPALLMMIEGDIVRDHAGAANQIPRRIGPAVDELGAQIDTQRKIAVVERVNPPAKAITGLEKQR
jgi:hypothetical protein